MTSDAYDWRFTDDLAEFLGRAGSFLRSRPALHTVQLTVADRLRTEGPNALGEEAPYFGWLADEDGGVRATVLRAGTPGSTRTSASLPGRTRTAWPQAVSRTAG
ncbi:hypothetical protein [Streptomyces sp. NPDC001020]